VLVGVERVLLASCAARELTTCGRENDETGPMILDQFAHAAAQGGYRPRSSSVSDIGADTAMSVVVIQSFPSICSRRNNDDNGKAAQE
jgi:hypothetical protein